MMISDGLICNCCLWSRVGAKPLLLFGQRLNILSRRLGQVNRKTYFFRD